MTQQQISKLLDVPDRTLRDWEKSRKRLYNLLESLDYNESKEKINVVEVDTDDVVVCEQFGTPMLQSIIVKVFILDLMFKIY